MNSYLAKAYATKMIDDATVLNLQLGAGISDYESKRFLYTGDIAEADYDSWYLQANVELERSYQMNEKAILTPFIHADYVYIDVDGYKESGGGALSLEVDDDSADSLVFGAGLKGNYDVSDKWTLEADAGIGYDVLTDRSNLTSSFVGGGANFSTQGIKPDEVVYSAGLGAAYGLDNGGEVTVRYDFNGREDYTEQYLSVDLRVPF